MRFRTFFFFLPHLATAGFFSDHIQRNLNHEIDPCDDFYDHVCSTTGVNFPYFHDEAEKWFYNTVQQVVSPTIREFRTLVKENMENFPKDEMNQEDTEALDQFFSKYGNQCTPSNLQLVKEYLFVIESYDAIYRLQSSPHYKTLEKKMEDIFVGVKNILSEEFLAAPWTKRHPKLVELLKNVKLDHGVLKDLKLEAETTTIKERYEECLSVTNNKTQKLSAECINYAVCPTMLLPVFDYGKVKPFYEYLTGRVGKALSFNAGLGTNKDETDSYFYLNPPLYALEEDDLPFMLGSLDFVMSHEMGHIFFHGTAVPSNSECLRKHMQNTCYSFISNKTECELYYNTDFDGRPTENGNYSRLGDDAADWIGMHSVLKSLRKHYPNVFTGKELADAPLSSTELMKKFFYAHAINWCSKKPEQGDEMHSPRKVRVNGIASLFGEFTEVFQCKRGNKMAKAATCLPFAGDGAPTRKRNGHQ